MPTPAFDAAQAAADPTKQAVNDQMAKQFVQRIDALRTNIAKVCNGGSVLVLVIRLIQLYWKVYSNLQILLDM